MLSKRQKEVLDFIKSYRVKKKFSPSLEEIRKRFKLASVSTVDFHVGKLEALGYLKRQYNKPRSIEIVKKERMVNVPLLGTIAAGQPIEAIQEKESIAVPQRKLPQSGDYYALRVVGNSMIDENINDGDIVLVKQQSVAENGQKVVALIDNYEATLKKYYKERGKIRLQPANKEIEPIIIKKDRELLIQGIVIDVIKNEPTEKEVSPNNWPKSERKKPKGGCELVYPGKVNEDLFLKEIVSVKLKLVRKYGNLTENKLVQGDNLRILKTLYQNNSIRGKVDLVYIDPPFGTGQEFVGYDEKNYYSDQIVNTEFLEFLRKRLVLLRELLTDSGSIYVHIDQKIGHYVKIILDEVFGEENFRNDITRIKCNPKNFERKAFGNIKDVIYFYSKSKPNGNDPITWTDYRKPLTEEDVIKQFPKVDEYDRRYATTPLHAKGETRNGPTGKPWKGLKPPKGRHWRYPPKELTRLDKQGLIKWSSTGNPRKIIYADENCGKKIQDIWDFRDPGYEKSHYPTEKNEVMLEQIIQASSNEGDLVLDCFAGSGTTLVTAEKLKRKWIGIDSNKSAIKVAEKRILEINKNNNLFDKPASFSVYQTI